MQPFEIETPRPFYPPFGKDPSSGKWVVDPVLVEFEDGNSAFWDRTTIRLLYKIVTLHNTTVEKIARLVAEREVFLYDLNSLLNRVTKITVDPEFKEMLKRYPPRPQYPYPFWMEL